MNIDELSIKITKFYYDFDTYEFIDNYDNFDIAVSDTKEALLNKELTKNMLNDLKDISFILNNENKKLYKECNILIKNLIEYINNFDSYTKNYDIIKLSKDS